MYYLNPIVSFDITRKTFLAIGLISVLPLVINLRRNGAGFAVVTGSHTSASNRIEYAYKFLSKFSADRREPMSKLIIRNGNGSNNSNRKEEL